MAINMNPQASALKKQTSDSSNFFRTMHNASTTPNMPAAAAKPAASSPSAAAGSFKAKVLAAAEVMDDEQFKQYIAGLLNEEQAPAAADLFMERFR